MDDLAREIAQVRRLLRAGLGLRGDDLPTQLRRGGRRLPRGVRAAAQRLAKAEGMAAQPKLARQLDAAALQRDAKLCVKHLTPLAQGRLIHGPLMRAASWAALIIFSAALVAAGLIYLRGQV